MPFFVRQLQGVVLQPNAITRRRHRAARSRRRAERVGSARQARIARRTHRAALHSTNALLSSVVSKGWFRRPVRIDVRTFALTRRSTAWFASRKLRPMSAAALIFKVDRAGNFWRRMSVGEPRRTVPSHSRQDSPAPRLSNSLTRPSDVVASNTECCAAPAKSPTHRYSRRQRSCRRTAPGLFQFSSESQPTKKQELAYTGHNDTSPFG